MLAQRRMFGKMLSWGLSLTAIAVGYVVVVESLQTGGGKMQANRIISPWDVSAAPPQFVKRHQIRMKPARVPAVKKAPPPEKPQHRRHTRHRQEWDESDYTTSYTRVDYR